MSRRDVFHHLPTLHPSQLLWNVCKINLIPVRRISAESTKKPVCEQRSEYEPTQDVSFMAYTIDKQVFSQKLFHSLYIHSKIHVHVHVNTVPPESIDPLGQSNTSALLRERTMICCTCEIL